MAAILSEERTREAVFEALRERRVYATNGPRILLRASLAGQRMGSVLKTPKSAEELQILVVSPAGVDRIEIVRSGKVVESVPGEQRRDLHLRIAVHDLRPGEYLYLRVVQDAATAAGVPCDVVWATHDHPYRAIIDTAGAKGCDLIVMASHGRKGVAAVVLGSETTKVLTHSKVPVLVCR